ncbi:MAG: ABC transporter permease [Faecousia sp.]
MKANTTSGKALRQVALRTLWRRKGASILLTAVAALGVFASVALQNVIARQETGMRDMVRNTSIHCVVTDAQGRNSEDLRMYSAFVDMLTGRRHERDCYLDEAVKNVRAKATVQLEQPQGMTLRRILSFDSDSTLSATEGANVRLFDGWTEDVFRTNAAVCMIPEGTETQCGEDGQQYVTAITQDGTSLQLQVIGTVSSRTDNAIRCPFYAQQDSGITELYSVESCSFDILDNERLDACKAAVYEIFVEPSLANTASSRTYGVLIQDKAYLSSLDEFRSTLSLLQLLLPILTVLFGGIGFLASYLMIRGRMREFSVMRCLGMKRRKIFAQVFGGQVLLAFLGAAVGGFAGFLSERSISAAAIGKAGLILAVFLAGAALASRNVTRVNVMKLMKVGE